MDLDELLFAVKGNNHHAPSQEQTRNETTEAGNQVEEFETTEIKRNGKECVQINFKQLRDSAFAAPTKWR
jgi:hypothetical protein